MAGNGTGHTWRAVALALGAMIVTGAGYWITIGRDKIDRREAIEIVQTYSPYVRDKAVIDQLRRTVETLGTAVGTLTVEVAKLRVEMEKGR